MTSIWSRACQNASHVGAAGIGLVCLKGAPVSTATTEFERYWDVGRAFTLYLAHRLGQNCPHLRGVLGFREPTRTLETLLSLRCSFFFFEARVPG